MGSSAEKPDFQFLSRHLPATGQPSHLTPALTLELHAHLAGTNEHHCHYLAARTTSTTRDEDAGSNMETEPPETQGLGARGCAGRTG